MNTLVKRTTFALVTIVLLSAPFAAAQNETTNQTGPTRLAPSTPQGWHEQSNELGVGQTLFQDLIDGEPRPFEARFYLNTLYKDKGVTYFLFAFITKQTPLTGSFDSLTNGNTGEDIPVYKQDTEEGGKVQKWFIDAANMPDPGVPIILRGTVGSSGAGQYQAGALLQPFNYKWEPVAMSSGTPASIYIGTQYGVNRATSSECTGKLCDVTEVLPSPAPAFVGLLAAAAVGAVALRRRNA